MRLHRFRSAAAADRADQAGRPDRVDRDEALRAIAALRKDRLLKPVAEPTAGSANDLYYAIQAGLGGG